MKPRHIPMRTCAGCRGQRPKREMARVVRVDEGSVVFDASGRRNGRGAYICQTADCWDRALRSGSLAHALKVPSISPDDRATLEQTRQELFVSLP